MTCVCGFSVRGRSCFEGQGQKNDAAQYGPLTNLKDGRLDRHDASAQCIMKYSLLLLSFLVASCMGQPEDSLRYQLIEEVRVGTRIADLADDAKLKAKYPQNILQQLQYGFLSQPTTNISVGTTNGLLFTRGRIDRDTICPGMRVCEVHLDIAVKPVAYFQIIKVTVEIVDLNDNKPEFPEPEITLSILESATPESGFVLPSAMDNDGPGFSIQRYELITDANKSKFSLKVNKNLDGSMDVRLVLERRLDREAQDRYSIKVIAYDGGSTPRSGSLSVNIHVIDTNDNEPVFDQTTYGVSVIENVPIRTVIATVHAADHDQGPNGLVRYGFSKHTTDKHGHLFGIDQESGEIYVKGIIDHEESDIYHLMVVAQDLGPGSLPTDATVVIHVQDINDNKPEITINTITEPNTDRAEIEEDSPPGTFVAHVSVTDKDDGVNGQFTCSLSERSFTLERRFPTEYQIVTNQTLDREKRASYSLAIVCRDHGKDKKISIEHLRVSVLDRNDNYPIFTERTYTASLIENNFVGKFIVHVNATDADVNENARVMYQLDGTRDSSFFTIDGDGKIRAKLSIDREVRRKFQFKVWAFDRGSPRRTGDAQVVINIEDVNDEKPTFSQIMYEFRLKENLPVGTSVGSVTAIDRDAPPFDSFVYSFAPRKKPDVFEIDPKSGLIRTKKSLDRERQGKYRFEVWAKDDVNPPGTADISIIVEDINDNSPVFLFPTLYNHSLTISNRVPVGFAITQIRAHDDDTREAAQLAYQITQGNDDEVFDLDPRYGTLTLKSSLGGISHRRYDLVLAVSDHGSPQQTAQGILNILVNQSVPFTSGRSSSDGLISSHNLIIVISLAGAIVIIVTVVVLTICLVRKNGRRKKDSKHYRMQALKNAGNSGSGSPPPANGSANRQGYKSVPDKQLSPKQRARSIETVFSASAPAAGENECQTIPIYSAPDKSRSHSSQKHQAHSGEPSNRDVDQCSQHSGDGSFTDSGRGPSEEGEALHHVRVRQNLYNAANLPQPTISGVRPLPPCPPPPPARAITSNYGNSGLSSYKAPKLQTFAPDNELKPGQRTLPAKHHVTFERSPNGPSHIYSNVPKPNRQSGVATLPLRSTPTKKMESIIV